MRLEISRCQPSDSVSSCGTHDYTRYHYIELDELMRNERQIIITSQLITGEKIPPTACEGDYWGLTVG